METRNFLLFTVLFFLLMGCAPAAPVSTDIPAGGLDPLKSSPPPEPGLTPSEVPETSTPTAALRSSPVCLHPAEHGPLRAAGFAEAPQGILEYLNSGAAPDELIAALDELGIASQPTSVVVDDFTGDGFFDVVVSIFDPASSFNPPAGSLLVYACHLGRYEHVLDLRTAPAGGPILWHWQDLNGDAVTDLVVSTAVCGAHTCFENVQVLIWDGAAFRNFLEGQTDDLPYPLVKVSDADGDGFFDLEIMGTGIGSVGAGPQRALTRVWGYDPFSGWWRVKEEIQGPSEYRIHALHDADATAYAGDFEIALVLYQRVIADPALTGWQFPEEEWANLAAYAYYKMIVILTMRNEGAQAETKLAKMETAFPPESAQYDFVEMAKLFRNAYLSTSLEAACQAAASLADSRPETLLTPLGSAAFGYANPDYTSAEMCPVRFDEP